jgi:hypothetical protein
VSKKWAGMMSPIELKFGQYFDTFSTIFDMSLVFFDTLWFSSYSPSKFLGDFPPTSTPVVGKFFENQLF